MSKKNIKLFFILPVCTIQENEKYKKWKIFNIPFLTRKTSKNGNKAVYKFLGVPILKIKRKMLYV